MFDFWWPCAGNARLADFLLGAPGYRVERARTTPTAGTHKTNCSSGIRTEVGCFRACWTTLTDRRQGIFDFDPGSVSRTISGTLPALSPGTWAGSWLHDPVNTRVMGPSIPARKESHGGGCALCDVGSGFDDKGSGKLKALFCKARRCRVGLLAQRNGRGENKLFRRPCQSFRPHQGTHSAPAPASLDRYAWEPSV